MRAILLLGVLVVLVACTRGETADRSPNPPGDVFPGGDVGSFTTLDDVVSGSDAVVAATVVNAAPGRTVGDIHYRALELRVVQVLYGSIPTETILVEEEGWIVEPGEDEIPVSPSHWDAPAEVGQTWIAALSYKEIGTTETGVPTYAVLAPAGFFLVESDGLRTSSDVTDDGGNPVASLSPDQLMAEIAEANNLPPSPSG